jgi:hypothetical protein
MIYRITDPGTKNGIVVSGIDCCCVVAHKSIVTMFATMALLLLFVDFCLVGRIIKSTNLTKEIPDISGV